MKSYLRVSKNIGGELVTLEKFIPTPPISLHGNIKLKINDRYLYCFIPEYVVEETFAYMVYWVIWPTVGPGHISIETLKNEGWYEIDNEPHPAPLAAAVVANPGPYAQGQG